MVKNRMLVLSILALAGCGGSSGGGSSSGAARGGITMRVNWPTPPSGRFIPNNALWVKVVATKSGDAPIVQKVQRPIAEVDFNNVPAGNYTLLAQSFRNDPGAGATTTEKPLSSNSAAVVVKAGEDAETNIVLNGTYSSLLCVLTNASLATLLTHEFPVRPTLSAPPTTVAKNGVYTLKVTPRSPQGDLVLFRSSVLVATPTGGITVVGVVSDTSSVQTFTITVKNTASAAESVTLKYTDNDDTAPTAKTYTIPFAVLP